MAYIGQEPGLGEAERFVFTATAVTDTVTADDDGVTIGYTVGQVSVYLNGVKQVVGDDVVASNGSTLVFDDDYAIGDVIEVIALSAFSPADTVPATGGTFSGNVIVPTATASGHAVTKAQLDGLVDSAPGALDTLNELAAALNDDAAFSTTVTNSIALKAPIASPTFTGTVTLAAGVDLETSTTGKIKQKGSFMQSSTHQALTLGA